MMFLLQPNHPHILAALQVQSSMLSAALLHKMLMFYALQASCLSTSAAAGSELLAGSHQTYLPEACQDAPANVWPHQPGYVHLC